MFAKIAHFQPKIVLGSGYSAWEGQVCVRGKVRVENPVHIRLIVSIGPIHLDFPEYTHTLAQIGAVRPPRALLSIVE